MKPATQRKEVHTQKDEEGITFIAGEKRQRVEKEVKEINKRKRGHISDLFIRADLKPDKGQIDFLHQPKGGLCLLYTVLNCFTLKERRAFLRLPASKRPIDYDKGDCNEFLNYSDEKTDKIWSEDGMVVATVRSWMGQLKRDGLISRYTLRAKHYLFLPHILLSRRNNHINKAYVLTGTCTTNPGMRKSAAARLAGFENRKGAEAKYRMLSIKECRERSMDSQWMYWINPPAWSQSEANTTRHAIALIVDQAGNIYVKDPGSFTRTFLLSGPGCWSPEGSVTAGNYLEAMKALANKMIWIEAITEIDIEAEGTYW